MLYNKKILITGATGFIGACLAHRLAERGAELHLIVRPQSNLWRIKDILDKACLHNINLRNKDEVESVVTKLKPKIIYHCATYGGYHFQKDTNKIFETNIIGTINLLNICSKVGFDCFVNTGSSSEYGIKNEPMKELDVLEPANDYGVAKASSTLFCQSVVRRYQLPIVSLRLFSPYGYYEEHTRLIPSVIMACLRGENPKLSSPETARDFVFIADVIDAYMKVVGTSDISGEIFNIGYGEQHSVGEVVGKIVELTGNKVRPEWESVPKRANEPNVWQADITKAKNVLKWVPKYSLDEGLSKTIKWFERNIEFYGKR